MLTCILLYCRKRMSHSVLLVHIFTCTCICTYMLAHFTCTQMLSHVHMETLQMHSHVFLQTHPYSTCAQMGSYIYKNIPHLPPLSMWRLMHISIWHVYEQTQPAVTWFFHYACVHTSVTVLSFGFRHTFFS